MTMEDDKIKELFSGFNPSLSPDDEFVERLERNINAVESVRQQSEKLRKQNKIAVAVAACSGFIAGVLLTLLLPEIWVLTKYLSLPILNDSAVMVDPSILGWLLTAGVSGVIAYNAYELTLSKLTSK